MSFINAESVAERLECFGVSTDEKDLTSIELIINGTEEYIMNYCNISSIPIELYNAAVDMCCGTFLRTKQSIGELEVINSNGDVSSVKEGDVTLCFKDGTGSGKAFDEIVDSLIDKRNELECFRKLKW